MIALLLSLTVSARYVTSCNYDINTCYYDLYVTNTRCEDLDKTFICKPVRVYLGEWLVVPAGN